MNLTKEQIQHVVMTLISEMSSVKPSGELTVDQSLQDLGFDSLRLMDLVVSAEDKIGVQLKDTYLTGTHLKTVDSLVSAFIGSSN